MAANLPEEQENDPVAALRNTLDDAKATLGDADENEDVLLEDIMGEGVPTQTPNAAVQQQQANVQGQNNQQNPQVSASPTTQATQKQPTENSK